LSRSRVRCSIATRTSFREMKRVHVAIKGANVDHTTHHRWGGEDCAACVVGPLHRQTTDGSWIENMLRRIGMGMPERKGFARSAS
jgi:hypothetical protein